MNNVSAAVRNNRTMSRLVVYLWTVLLLPGCAYYAIMAPNTSERAFWIAIVLLMVWQVRKWWKTHPQI